jgi:hypothetical protein
MRSQQMGRLVCVRRQLSRCQFLVIIAKTRSPHHATTNNSAMSVPNLLFVYSDKILRQPITYDAVTTHYGSFICLDLTVTRILCPRFRRYRM